MPNPVLSSSMTYYRLWNKSNTTDGITRAVTAYPSECTCSLPVLVGFMLHNRQLSVQCIANHCLSFCRFSFSHDIVPPSSICGFWLPLWYFRTFLPKNVEQPQYKLQTTFVCKFVYLFFITEMQLQRNLYLLIPRCLLTSLCNPPTHPQPHYRTWVRVIYLQMVTVTLLINNRLS